MYPSRWARKWEHEKEPVASGSDVRSSRAQRRAEGLHAERPLIQLVDADNPPLTIKYGGVTRCR